MAPARFKVRSREVECDLDLSVSLECLCNPVFKNCKDAHKHSVFVTFPILATCLGEGEFGDLELISPSGRAV